MGMALKIFTIEKKNFKKITDIYLLVMLTIIGDFSVYFCG